MKYRQLFGIWFSLKYSSFNLNITEAVVRETGMPRRSSPLPLPIGLGVVTYRVFVIMLATCLALVTCALGSEFFRNKQCNLLAWLAADGDFGESGG